MRIAIGADHAGFLLKQHLLGTIAQLGHEIDDRGTTSETPVDYPPICAEVARLVAGGKADRADQDMNEREGREWHAENHGRKSLLLRLAGTPA